MTFTLRIFYNIKIDRSISFISETFLNNLFNKIYNFRNVLRHSSNYIWKHNIESLHIFKKFSFPKPCKLWKFFLLFIRSLDDLIINIGYVHTHFDIVSKVISHYSSDYVWADVSFSMAQMRMVVDCWSTHIPRNYILVSM